MMTRSPLQSKAQRTLRSQTIVEGVALFTGLPSKCTIQPAKINQGLTFRLNNNNNTNSIPVNPQNISHAPVHPAFANIPPRCSALTNKGSTIWLVEHILSALAGTGVTNAIIEVDHCELPIMDGSSLAFTQAIQKTGIESQDAPIDPIVINKVIRVEQEDSWIEVSPAEWCSYEYTIDYGPDSPIPHTTVHWDGQTDTYIDRIAPARTFCLEHEAEALIKGGLFKHLNPGDMLVLGDSGPINNTLRDTHECALHKLLDLIGDLALLGKPINAHIRAHKSGHTLAHSLARSLTHAIIDAQ
ncbi:MAG: UDP-3-O-[3-hydroxymyristoyl] N-acetylglucosamine deacetylase [Phycisphaerales bacterium]|nr:UDP-3-O-[3-hydroxymyristoyl] N-acetylglucosamine deacetylase [Phycisphaerales bacterium]